MTRNVRAEEFKLAGLLKEIALGTGFGLRYDFGFIVLRGDLRIALHTLTRIRISRDIIISRSSRMVVSLGDRLPVLKEKILA